MLHPGCRPNDSSLSLPGRREVGHCHRVARLALVLFALAQLAPTPSPGKEQVKMNGLPPAARSTRRDDELRLQAQRLLREDRTLGPLGLGVTVRTLARRAL